MFERSAGVSSHSGCSAVRWVGAGIAAAVLMFATACPPGGGGTPDGGTEVDASCKSECDTAGKRTCSGEGTVERCEETEGGCLQLVEVVDCPSYKTCRDGTCVEDDTSCSDRCAPGDPSRCNARGQVVDCDDFDDDGCWEWGNPTDCDTGQTCDDSSGMCVDVNCSDQCTSGDAKCEGDLIRHCEQASNGCLEYAAAEPCPSGEVCSSGECQPEGSCRDECTEAICTTSGEIRRCKDVDGDGCDELAGAESCPSGESCDSGMCSSGNSCSDECPKGEKICVNSKIAECGDHDSDPCVEFSQPMSCSGNKVCVNDGSSVSCKTPQSSGKVVLNEVLFDAMGSDLRGSGSSATSPVFVELGGPSGFDVSGYEIELINGANGSSYGTFTLPSGASLDGTGYAVASMKRPNSYFTQTAPSMTNLYKILQPYRSGGDAIQNGPDNIVLKDDTGTVVDALGYGSFSSSNTFKGEGSPASSVVSGRSLGRTDLTDSDDNSTDFTTYYPTPGLQNSDLLVNEVYANQPGRDDKTQTFVEIAAPIPNWEDLPLDGYVVRAINGYNGNDYLPSSGNGIKLFGNKLHDGSTDDGYFVICNEKAQSPPNGPPCNVKYKGGDWQNGPDNVVLEYKGTVVDAIGYGSFGSSDVFKGEGSEIGYSYSDAGKSLSRWPLPNQFFDFDDNSLDFWLVTPTPGTTNKNP